MTEKIKTLLTIGNPNGIGPEITASALKRLPRQTLDRFCVVGEKTVYETVFDAELRSSLTFLETDFPNYRYRPGEQTRESGIISFLFLQKALETAKRFPQIRSIVTAPISKELVIRSGFPDTGDFIGHTEFFARGFDVTDYSMMFYSEDFCVLLATIHTPIAKLVGEITAEKVQIAIRNAQSFCEKRFGREYRIALCGLNPHAGENGILGSEEIETIAPEAMKAREAGTPIDGPLPADTVFYYAKQGKYKMVIAMYHDQGLAPFKMLHLHDGVNVTLGLPILRTSPDHGTAFDIAGKGVASDGSMSEAIRLAMDWSE